MLASRIEFHRRWIEQCEAARRIIDRFGVSNALEYLIGEKLLASLRLPSNIPNLLRNCRILLAKSNACSASTKSVTTWCISCVPSRLVHPSGRPSERSHQYRRKSTEAA